MDAKQPNASLGASVNPRWPAVSFEGPETLGRQEQAALPRPALLQQSPGEDIFSLKGLSCAFEPISMKDGKMQARNLQVFGGDGVMMLGSIKTYNPKNQYGFIETSMLDGDVYFKGQDLPMGLAGTDVKGFQVRFSATTLKDGKMQARDILVVGLAGAPGMRARAEPHDPSAAHDAEGTANDAASHGPCPHGPYGPYGPTHGSRPYECSGRARSGPPGKHLALQWLRNPFLAS
ncbi:unnamed protein product [Effrenium voratum]|nr:unnamed protein product [Effrenium voratum]